MMAPDAVRASRLKLAMMFLLPLLAVGLATLVFYTGIGIPRGTTNKGVLMQPPRQIDELRIVAADGKAWRHQDAQPDWSLLVIGEGPCAGECRQRLYLTRQIRTALGRDAERITRYYLQLDGAPDPEFAAFIGKEHPDLQLLRGERVGVQALLGRPGDPDPVAGHPVYIVDQRGFVMMYYLPAQSGRDTIDDLRFLLKYSREKVR